MSTTEWMDNQDALIALPHDIRVPGIASVPKLRVNTPEGSTTFQKRDSSSRGERLRPLLGLAPYLARYRTKVIAALIALTVASLATLVVPVAVRRMIDFGFTADSVSLINRYFSLMIAVVAVLALASASRVYLVTTLGERIVADLRRDVFSHRARNTAPRLLSVLARDPVENSRGCYCLLRRVGIQSTGNRTPAFRDNLLGESLRLRFGFKFAGRANDATLPILALGRDIGAIGNVPDIRLCHAIRLEQGPHANSPEANRQYGPSLICVYSRNLALRLP